MSQETTPPFAASLAVLPEDAARDRLATLISEARDLARLLDYAEVAFLLETTTMALPPEGDGLSIDALSEEDFQEMEKKRDTDRSAALLARFGLIQQPRS